MEDGVFSPMDISKLIKDALCTILSNSACPDPTKKLKVFQRSRKTKTADFVVALSGCLAVVQSDPGNRIRPSSMTMVEDEVDCPTKSSTTHSTELKNAPIARCDIEKLQIAEQVLSHSKSWPVEVSCSLNTSDHYLHVNMVRNNAYTAVISQTLPPPIEQPQSPDCVSFQPRYGEHIVLLNNVEEFLQSSSGPVSLSFVRAALVKNHLRNLLIANRYHVKTVHYNVSESIQELHDYFCVEKNESAGHCGVYERVVEDLVCSAYSEEKESSASQVVVDLARFMDDHNLTHGKKGYDLNVEECRVDLSLPDVRLSQVTKLEGVLSEMKTIGTEVECSCIHLVSQPHQFNTQQVDLLWQTVSPASRGIKHTLCVLGPVQSRKGNDELKVTPTAHEFLRLREEQMKDISVLKYGEQVKGPLWDSTIKAMAQATVVFDFITTVPNNPVKLEVDAVPSKGGAFVMYNYARLSTMFQRYDESVRDGVYPPMPDVSSVDFSHLKDEMEWHLLLSYVYTFPLLVRDLAADLAEDAIFVKLPTHQVCNFLCNLSRDLSSYYNRVHVLGEPKAHLFPLMFARLYLLKSVQKVMRQGLQLLGLTPLEQV